ncbi:hypothetical protein [Dechloromonas sp. TW-R-39-2]|uniref:hypothetical protein n=1 Tax=Dechloromonas sp. TW-R-39-2 TaxID=2654218 RepID=UPI00193DE4D5|nr:hypothetical protein [Dechloromonas sp. TW-R-39-2]
MNEAGLYGIRVSNEDALSAVIESLIQTNPELSIDDCLDAIFSVGLISVSSTLTLALPK